MSWKRVVDWAIWGLYLAAILLCAYVTAYAAAVERWEYVWMGGIGWAVSGGWGLFFRLYVMDVRGKRRKPRKGVAREGGEFAWHPVWGWFLRRHKPRDVFLKGRDV